MSGPASGAAAAELSTVAGLAEAARKEAWEDEADARAWVDAVRVAARDAERRKELRRDAGVCDGVGRAMDADATAAAAALANLVVDDNEAMEACRALETAIRKLLAAAVDRVGVKSGGDDGGGAKFDMVCTIALRNISQQVTASAEAAPLLERLTGSDLSAGLFAACCRGSAASMRENALGAVDAFCAGSAAVKSALLDAEAEANQRALAIVSEALGAGGDEDGCGEALELVSRICEYAGAVERDRKGNATAAMPAKAVGALCACGIAKNVGALVKSADYRARASGALAEMAKLALTAQGAPEQDDDFAERISLLQTEGVTSSVLETLQCVQAPFGEAEINLAQLLAALVVPLRAGQATKDAAEDTFGAARDALVAAVRTASEALGPLVALLRSNASDRADSEASIRGNILPLARFRLFCLGGLNTMSGSAENASGFLAPGSQVCMACNEVITVTFDFDIEATRFALNILRNLCLEASNRVLVLSAVEDAQALGATLARVATKSKDPNSAGLAAAVVRLVASSRDPELFERLVTPETCDALVLAVRARTLAFAHVEIGRALAHAAMALKDSLQQEGLGRHVGVTAAMTKVCFLLQSNQTVLFLEALEALEACPPALLSSLQSSVSLELSKEGTSSEKLSLRQRLEQLKQLEAGMCDDDSRPEDTARVSELAHQVAARL